MGHRALWLFVCPVIWSLFLPVVFLSPTADPIGRRSPLLARHQHPIVVPPFLLHLPQAAVSPSPPAVDQVSPPPPLALRSYLSHKAQGNSITRNLFVQSHHCLAASSEFPVDRPPPEPPPHDCLSPLLGSVWICRICLDLFGSVESVWIRFRMLLVSISNQFAGVPPPTKLGPHRPPRKPPDKIRLKFVSMVFEEKPRRHVNRKLVCIDKSYGCSPRLQVLEKEAHNEYEAILSNCRSPLFYDFHNSLVEFIKRQARVVARILIGVTAYIVGLKFYDEVTRCNMVWIMNEMN